MMLSFIRKRLPSKDRNNEHVENIKSIEKEVLKFDKKTKFI
jgi:hypothetical protein